MVRKFEDVIASLPKERQEVINHGIEQLIAEEMTLQEIRKAHDFSQKVLASTLNVNQGTISKMERQADMLVSTLRSFIEAMGGSLEITASFPDHSPVKISQFEDLQEENEKKEIFEATAILVTHKDTEFFETTVCKVNELHSLENIGVKVYDVAQDSIHENWEFLHLEGEEPFVMRDSRAWRAATVRITNKKPYSGSHSMWVRGIHNKP